MIKLPLVSIIVPIYNVETYLEICLQSIIKQTYLNTEIILVDDGSTDKCGEICDQYADRDKRIRVVHKKNGGLSDARNAGLNICEGEYIAFVDSDDLVHQRYIEALMENIGDADMIYCKYADFTQENAIDIRKISSKPNRQQISARQYLDGLLDLNNTLLVVAWNKLYKKQLWTDIRYKTGILHEDEFVIHHLVSQCNQIAAIDEILYFYRQRQTSITADKKSEQSFLDKVAVFYNRYCFFTEQKMPYHAQVMLRQILYRCAMKTIKQDNSVWQNIGNFHSILFTKGLGLKIRIALLLKRTCYPLYVKLFSFL